MANPLYGQNKADDILDALASASDNIDIAVGSGSGKIGNANAVADAGIPISINGVDYVLALYAAAKLND